MAEIRVNPTELGVNGMAEIRVNPTELGGVFYG